MAKGESSRVTAWTSKQYYCFLHRNIHYEHAEKEKVEIQNITWLLVLVNSVCVVCEYRFDIMS